MERDRWKEIFQNLCVAEQDEKAAEKETIKIEFKGDVDVHMMQSGKRITIHFGGEVDGERKEVFVELATSSLQKVAKDMVSLALSARRK